ncbi:MAG: protein phosphatase 2C domain-containing protein [Muribaculaceae bacterium]|nr:protein phosphatase 2C domain-containing protein [Muribaculaceae bacterium]
MKPIDTKTPFIAVAESRIGGRSENQDTCAWQDTKHGLLLLVCDGMGGGPSGKMASQMAADAIVNSVLDSKETADRRDVITRAVKAAAEALLAAQAAEPKLRGMGTTVTALLINEQSAIVAHVGDSRVYQLRGTTKVFRTFDHSKVFELVKAGALTEEKARLSGESNIITRALGPMGDVVPDVAELPYEKGDRFMLCTDGIWGAFPEKELLQIAGGTKSLAGAVESLAIKVDELGNAHGGNHDNLTVAMLQTTLNSKLKQKMSTKIKYTLYALAALCCISLLANFIQYRAYKHSNPTRKELASTNPNDSVVTRAELERLLDEAQKRNDEELEKYRRQMAEQDEFYASRLDEYMKYIESNTQPQKSEDNKKKSEEKPALTQDMNKDKESLQVISDINVLIADVNNIGKIKQRGKKLDDAVSAASKKMDALTKKVKEMNIQNEKFIECVNKKWITNSITKDVANKNREGHIKAIIKALESLNNQIKSNPTTKK